MSYGISLTGDGTRAKCFTRLLACTCTSLLSDGRFFDADIVFDGKTQRCEVRGVDRNHHELLIQPDDLGWPIWIDLDTIGALHVC